MGNHELSRREFHIWCEIKYPLDECDQYLVKDCYNSTTQNLGCIFAYGYKGKLHSIYDWKDLYKRLFIHSDE